MILSEKILRDAMPNITTKNVVKYLPILQAYLPKYGIDTALRISHFLAQVGHETLDFLYYRELASGEAYDTGKRAISLGNTPEKDGDGQKYKGRGAIQCTGKSNYRECSLFIFGDDTLLKQPELLELPLYGVLAAMWFWTKHKLNNYADIDDCKRISIKINGGTNGLKDRLRRLSKAKKALGIY